MLSCQPKCLDISIRIEKKQLRTTQESLHLIPSSECLRASISQAPYSNSLIDSCSVSQQIAFTEIIRRLLTAILIIYVLCTKQVSVCVLPSGKYPLASIGRVPLSKSLIDSCSVPQRKTFIKIIGGRLATVIEVDLILKRVTVVFQIATSPWIASSVRRWYFLNIGFSSLAFAHFR